MVKGIDTVRIGLEQGREDGLGFIKICSCQYEKI